MQWLIDNWIALVATGLAVYGATLSTVLAVLQRRDRRDRILIEHPFWTKGDPLLRVKVINDGQRPVYVHTATVTQKVETWESGSQLVPQSMTLQAKSPDVSSKPIDTGDHRFYDRPRSDLSKFGKFQDALITVTTRRGKKFRKDIDPAKLRDDGDDAVN